MSIHLTQDTTKKGNTTRQQHGIALFNP